MKRRGRPSEQLSKELSEGHVWSVVTRLRTNGDYGRSIRDVARLSRCSIGAVAKTMAWKGYLLEKRSPASKRRGMASVAMRRRREAESVEGRVIQIVKEVSGRNDFSLTVRRIATDIGCSTGAVGKTLAWKGYVDAREEEKESVKARRKGLRIM